MAQTPYFTVTSGAGSTLLTRQVTLRNALEAPCTVTAALGSKTASVTLPAGRTVGVISLSAAWYSEIPYNARYAAITLTATADGASYTVSDRLAAPSDGPTCLALSYDVVAGDVPVEWGIFVVGHSKIHVRTPQAAQARYGAQIANYQLQYGNQSVNCGASGVDHETPILTEKITFTLVVTDTRGNRSVLTGTPTQYLYEAPTLSGILSVRCDSEGAEQEDGTYGLCRAEAAFTSLGNHNSVQVAVSYRRKGVSAWISGGTMTDGQLITGGNLLAQYNYEVRYTVTDGLGVSNVYTDIISRSMYEMHIRRGGGAWAFGGVADKPGALHVWGDVIADNFKTMDMHYFNVAANGSFTFHMANYTHVILFFLGYTHASRGIMLISCGSSGNITGSLLSQSSSPQLALSGSGGGDVTLNSTYGSAIYCLAIAYHGTKPTY